VSLSQVEIGLDFEECKMKDQIKKIIESIKPLDTLEAEHISAAIEWIESGVEIFRIEKPATPPKHLVSYFVLIDPEKKKIMLIDHIKAGLWLPAGGHVEKDEHPNIAVEREIQEELYMPAEFIDKKPLFITQTVTVGKTAGHTDVSLWYMLKADSAKEIKYDPGEFNGYKWFDYEEILNTDISKFDPHMHRFAKKLFASDLIKS
jgi:8-oxo-dGTP diphosphatase